MALDTGQLNLMTKEQYWPDVVSQVTTDTAFLTRLFKKKKMRGSGRSFKQTMNVLVADGQWFSGYEILDVSQDDPFKEAEWDWVGHNMPVSISEDELDKNTGKEAFHDLMDEKMKYAVDSSKKALGYAIFQGRGSAYKEPDGLYNRQTTANSAISELPTSGTYGGIVRGTDDGGAGLYTNWWQNGYKDVSGALALNDMQKAIQDCEKNGARPSIIVAAHEGMSTYYNQAKGAQRVDSDEISSIGFKSFVFAGIPVVADKYCYRDSSGSECSYYFMDESDLELRFLNGKYMHRTPWFTPKDQAAKVMHIRNKFIFAVRSPRKHWLLHGVTEA
jgi:hypothetical protein